MKASEIIKKNFTEEEFNKLLNSNNKIRKSLGWHTPPTGHPGVSGNEPYTVKPFGDELYKETPKQERRKKEKRMHILMGRLSTSSRLSCLASQSRQLLGSRSSESKLLREIHLQSRSLVT